MSFCSGNEKRLKSIFTKIYADCFLFESEARFRVDRVKDDDDEDNDEVDDEEDNDDDDEVEDDNNEDKDNGGGRGRKTRY